MPELPEVEVARLSIIPHVEREIVCRVAVYDKNLRWPVPDELLANLPGNQILSVSRKGKYLLLKTIKGTALIHLGMTGFIRILSSFVPPGKHDHFDVLFQKGSVLRFNDVRKFGSILWFDGEPDKYDLLRGLGPEPLTDLFDGTYLYDKSRNRKITVKQFLMDHHVVSGIGNIYANESLFVAGIRPTTQSRLISKARYSRIADAVKKVLQMSINTGGTMLDFRSGNELYGYFDSKLMVYRQAGKPCKVCGNLIQSGRSARRSFYYCNTCQR